MHRNHLQRFSKLILILFALSFPFISSAQNNQDLIKALNSKLIPIKTLSPDSDYTDLQPLKTILKNKGIVGLGEATHGTHDFFVYKHRMLEFLVKEMGYKVFAIEANFAGTQTMNDYVVYGKGTVYKGLWDMGIGVWMTQEFVDMVNWLKDYNAGKPLSERVHFYGCDMQGNQAASVIFRNYLTKTKQLTSVLDSGITQMAKYGSALTKDDKEQIRTTITALRQIPLTSLPDDSVQLFDHDIRAVEQYMDLLDAQSTLFPARTVDLRDKYMAENCAWIYNYIKGDKMIIWAHNQHIGELKNSSGITPMGSYLKSQFKDNYYAFGFGFNSGTIRAYDESSKKYQIYDILTPILTNSADAIFAKCDYPNFILDFKSTSTSPDINIFLNTDLRSHAIGADFVSRLNNTTKYYVKQKLADVYDGIIFIRETTAATPEKIIKKKP
ncbi:erythromycin esterase family protein [Mucilaginibacter sp.]